MPIEAYTGLMRQGKTLSMVRQARADFRYQIAQQRKKRRSIGFTVYTNMAGLRFPGAVFVENFEMLTRCEQGLVLLDEAGLWMPSRLWSQLPRDMLYMLAQSGKAGLSLYYTEQFFEMADRVLRELTMYVHRVFKIPIVNLFYVRTIIPQLKQGFGFDLFFFDKVAAALYETFERIGNPISGEGRRRGSRLSQLSLREGEQDGLAALLAAGKRDIVSDIKSDLKGHPSALSRDENTVIRWLKSIGMYHPRRQSFNRLLSNEVYRLRWLRLFGLDLQDVPLWCSPATPWAIPPPYTEHTQAEKLEQVPWSAMSIEQGDIEISRFWLEKDYSSLALVPPPLPVLLTPEQKKEKVHTEAVENPIETLGDMMDSGFDLSRFIKISGTHSK